MEKINIEQSDAQKILDALKENTEFHRRRDEMNAQVHLAKEVRQSPITSTTVSAYERLTEIMNEEITGEE